MRHKWYVSLFVNEGQREINKWTRVRYPAFQKQDANSETESHSHHSTATGGLCRRPRDVKMTLILATSISDITSQYVCITYLHSNLDYANGKLRSFLPHDFDRFLFAKQLEFKITDSVYNKCTHRNTN